MDFVPGICDTYSLFPGATPIYFIIHELREGRVILEVPSWTTLIDPSLSSIYCYFNMDKIVLCESKWVSLNISLSFGHSGT